MKSLLELLEKEEDLLQEYSHWDFQLNDCEDDYADEPLREVDKKLKKVQKKIKKALKKELKRREKN